MAAIGKRGFMISAPSLLYALTGAGLLTGGLFMARAPNNGWALHGLAATYQRQGKPRAAATARKQFTQAGSALRRQTSPSCSQPRAVTKVARVFSL
jgi:hypothetical protein